MSNTLDEHNNDICHKCGSENTQWVFYSFHGNELKLLDYECADCGGTWRVEFEMVNVTRNNDDD